MDKQTDTPIQNINIKPAPPTSVPPPSSHTNSSNVSPHRGRKIGIHTPPTIIKVLKKPSKKLPTSTYPKKFTANRNSTDDDPIYFTRAKVNGSFRHSPGRARDAKQLWHAFRIKSDPIPFSSARRNDD